MEDSNRNDIMLNLNFRVIHGFSGINFDYIKNVNFSCLCLNIRSLRKNWNTFCVNVGNLLSCLKIIVLVEINIQEEENSKYTINGFTAEFLNRNKRRGGGIAMFIKNNLNYERIYIQSLAYECLRIQILDEGKIKYVDGIYRPPKLKRKRFIEELGRNLQHLGKKSDIVVLGDMNIDIRKSDKNHVKDYLEMLAAHGLMNVIQDDTRVDPSRGTSTLIQHIAVSMSDSPVLSAVIESDISDHHAVFYGTIAQGTTNTKEYRTSFIRNSTVDVHILSTDWEPVLAADDVDELYQKLLSTMHDIYEKSTVSKLLRSKCRQNPWISPDLREKCKQRDTLYRRWRSNRMNKSYEAEYKRFRNMVNKDIFVHKSSYYRKKFNLIRSDPRKTWNIVNEILGKKKPSLDEVITKNFPAEKCVSRLSNKFAENFSHQILRIVHKCNMSTSNHSNIVMPNSIFIEETTTEEIHGVLKLLSENKPAGVDGIRARDIKAHANVFAPIIARFINLSLTQAIIPHVLKTAVVRPIYKGGVKSLVSNYRPISILSVIEKCMEEVVTRRLLNYVDKHAIIHEKQYGFQKNKSTGKLLAEFSNTVNESLNKNHHVLVLFIDFSKAFDTLNHVKLLEALNRLGIRGMLADWLQNYLSSRSFRVRIKDTCSDDTAVLFGVPQGSKLGPILFILFTNELLRVFKHSTPFAFADDTAIVVTHKCLDTATRIMQNEFDKAVEWCHDNGLVLNHAKTKMMHIRGPRHKATRQRINFRSSICQSALPDQVIEVVECYKYLGVTIDSNFIWDRHINKLRSDLKKALFALYYLGSYSTTQVQKQVYYALVESKLRYGVLAWGNASNTHLNKLQKLQNTIVKKISSRNGTNSSGENCFKVLGAQQIFKMTLALEYYDDNRFQKPIDHQFNTRRRAHGMLQTPRSINNYGRRQLENSVPTTLNELPQNLRNIRNFKTRKKLLKEFFLN